MVQISLGSPAPVTPSSYTIPSDPAHSGRWPVPDCGRTALPALSWVSVPLHTLQQPLQASSLAHITPNCAYLSTSGKVLSNSRDGLDASALLVLVPSHCPAWCIQAEVGSFPQPLSQGLCHLASPHCMTLLGHFRVEIPCLSKFSCPGQ